MPSICTETKVTRGKAAPIGEAQYMGARQLRYFTKVLEERKQELLVLTDSSELVDSAAAPDPVDRAAQETERNSAATAIERAWRQIREINLALARITSGDYGYCEDTGEPIGFDRLKANPSARYTVEALTVREKQARRFAS